MVGEAQRKWLAADLAKVERTNAIRDLPLADIIADDDLRQFAASGGLAAYKVNCVQCHGSGAAGSASADCIGNGLG